MDKAEPPRKRGLGTPPFCESKPLRLNTIFTASSGLPSAGHSYQTYHGVQIGARSKRGLGANTEEFV